MTVDVQMTDSGVIHHLEEGVPFSEKYRPQSLGDVASHKAGDGTAPTAGGSAGVLTLSRSHALLPRFCLSVGHNQHDYEASGTLACRRTTGGVSRLVFGRPV
jgi:hypothetical protein